MDSVSPFDVFSGPFEVFSMPLSGFLSSSEGTLWQRYFSKTFPIFSSIPRGRTWGWKWRWEMLSWLKGRSDHVLFTPVTKMPPGETRSITTPRYNNLYPFIQSHRAKSPYPKNHFCFFLSRRNDANPIKFCSWFHRLEFYNMTYNLVGYRARIFF